MHFLICSGISIPEARRTLPDWRVLEQLGHSYFLYEGGRLSKLEKQPDVIVGMSISKLAEMVKATDAFPKAQVYYYHWDAYNWVWTRPRKGEYDYTAYGKFLTGRCKHIWVPSRCTGIQMQNWWKLSNWTVVHPCCPYWEYPAGPQDKGYALCTLRQIPDPWWGKFEAACEKLRIPHVSVNHKYTYPHYQDAVANCRFMVSHMTELSTGGLSLLEGYYHGKPCLLSDSPWHGGKDYFGDLANYFDHNSEEDFEHKLLYMWKNPIVMDPIKLEQRRTWIRENFSDLKMVQGMLATITNA
jgi:hypothetical protein